MPINDNQDQMQNNDFEHLPDKLITVIYASENDTIHNLLFNCLCNGNLWCNISESRQLEYANILLSTNLFWFMWSYSIYLLVRNLFLIIEWMEICKYFYICCNYLH